MPRASELTEELHRRGPRPAGSDAERRAAAWAARQVDADPRRQVRTDTLWLRPGWRGAQFAHIVLAVLASLLSTTHALVGLILLATALLAMLADWRWCRSPGRLLTRERATQNVVSVSTRTPRVRLILTANLDTTEHDPRLDTTLPGWLFWVVLATAWLLLTALARLEGSHTLAVAVLQLIPTVALILAAAGLALGGRPADNAGGVAAALTLLRLLDAAPPAHLGVDLVLSGAGVGDGQGLRRLLRAERRARTAPTTVVLGFSAGPTAPTAPPGPHDPTQFLASEGPLLPLGCFSPLRRLAGDTGLLRPGISRGVGPALPARLRRLPALDLRGDPDALVQAGLELVDRIDAYVGEIAARGRQTG
ncbi:MAG TPA: hypothetical protein VFN48_01705 [Solirubrobacteraceae bacterium]|nr:hypothetical protein [Solirubrobacteraceae bacterium]